MKLIINIIMFTNLIIICNAQTLFIENQIIVKMEEEFSTLSTVINRHGIAETGINEIDNLNVLYGCVRIKKMYRGPNENATGLYIFIFSELVVNENLVQQYSQLNSIAWTEFDFLFNIGQTYPVDWNDSLETGLTQMKAPDAWDINTGNPFVIIQSNDTGVDYAHPDLGENIWQNLGEDIDGDGQVLQQIESGEWVFDPGDSNGVDDDNNGYVDDFVGWDFYNDHNQPSPAYGSQHSHGTSTSGTSIQVGNNNIEGVGVSWNSKAMVANTSFRTPSGVYISNSSARSAILYAIDNGAHIINMSWGSRSENSQLHTTLTTAYNSNLVLVAAAMHTSDGGTTTPWYPAAWDKVIGVTAVNLDDTKSTIAQYGNWVNVSAPRFDYSTKWHPDGDEHTVEYFGGQTSTAAPYTSGLAALIISVHPAVTNQLVYSIIKYSTDDISEANADSAWENLMGTGRINAEKALRLTQFVLDNEIQEILTGDIDSNIEGNVLLINTVNIVNDINVAPEAVMLLYPGTELNIINNTTLNIEGTFTAHGTEEKPIHINGNSTITSNNANISLQNVHFNNLMTWFRSSSGNAENCSFNTVVGTVVEGGNSFRFNECTFNSDFVGLATSSRPGEPRNNVTLENCVIEDCNIGLLTSYRAITTINHCEIRNNDTGILSDGFSEPWLFQGEDDLGCDGNNNIIINNGIGARVLQDAQPWFGIYSEYFNVFEGHNRFDNNIDIDNSSVHQRDIYAHVNNWYSGNGCLPSSPNYLIGPVIWEPTVHDVYYDGPPIWDDEIVLRMEAGGDYANAAQL